LLAPQSIPSVSFKLLVDALEPESDADSLEAKMSSNTDGLEAKVSLFVDTLFEVHEQACVETAMTCKRHSVWRLHPLKQRFKVNTPKPHPGLEYRLTKRLHDRAGKTACNGEEVEGSIEECGLWLLVETPRSNGMTKHYYLPMCVGDYHLVQEIDHSHTALQKREVLQDSILQQNHFVLCKEPATCKEQFQVRERRRNKATTGRAPVSTPIRS